MKNKIKTGMIILIISLFGISFSTCEIGNNNCTTHDWEWTPNAIEETCREPSKDTATCRNAGCTATDFRAGTIAPSPNAHNWEWTLNVIAPTCTEPSKDTATCKNVRCTEANVRTGTIPITHDFDWNISGIKTCKLNNCNANPQIGDTGPAGGVIFYIADGEEDRSLGFTVQGYTGVFGTFSEYTAFYLEAAPSSENQRVSLFPNVYYENSLEGITAFYDEFSVEASIIGNGRRDTQIIVNFLGPMASGTAAMLCASKSLNGFNDWFLPSFGELNKLFETRVSSLSTTVNLFWSSSLSSEYSFGVWILSIGQVDDTYVHNWLLRTGSDSSRVHAIRAF